MAYVQDFSQAGTTGGGTTVTQSVTVSAGNTLVAWVTKESAATVAVSDPSNGTWTPVRTVSNGSVWTMSAFVVHNVAAGTYTVTGSWTGSTGYRGIYIQEYSGRSGLDNSAGQRQTTGTSRSSGTFTVAANADIAAFCQDYNVSGTPSATTGTSRAASLGYGSTNSARGSSEDAVSGGTDEATFSTVSGADSFTIAMSLAVAGGGGGGGSGLTPKSLLMAPYSQSVNRSTH